VETSPRREDSQVSFTAKDRDDKKMAQIKVSKILKGNLSQLQAAVNKVKSS